MTSSTISAPVTGSTSPTSGTTYANAATAGSASSLSNAANNNNQTYAQVRAKLRPTAGFYSQYSGECEMIVCEHHRTYTTNSNKPVKTAVLIKKVAGTFVDVGLA